MKNCTIMFYDKQQGDILQSLANSSWCIFLACKDKLDILIVCTEVRGKAWPYCMQQFFCSVLMSFDRDFCFCWGSHRHKPLTTQHRNSFFSSWPFSSLPVLKVTYNQPVLPKAFASCSLLCQRSWCSHAASCKAGGTHAAKQQVSTSPPVLLQGTSACGIT